MTTTMEDQAQDQMAADAANAADAEANVEVELQRAADTLADAWGDATPPTPGTNLTFEEKRQQQRVEISDKIDAAKVCVADLAVRVAELKESTKSVQQLLEAEVTNLREFERELEHHDDNVPTPGPLFDGVKASEAKPAEVVDDAWKAVHVDALGLKDHVARKLIEGGVSTFEQLEKWRASHGEDPKIKGMGDAAKQDVEDAVVRYWTDHAQKHGAVVVKTPEQLKQELDVVRTGPVAGSGTIYTPEQLGTFKGPLKSSTYPLMAGWIKSGTAPEIKAAVDLPASGTDWLYVAVVGADGTGAALWLLPLLPVEYQAHGEDISGFGGVEVAMKGQRMKLGPSAMGFMVQA